MNSTPVGPAWLSHVCIVYFDLETTGLDTAVAETVEIAGKLDPMCHAHINSRVSDAFTQLVRPASGLIPVEATAIHKISASHVQSSDSFSVAIVKFFDWLTSIKREYNEHQFQCMMLVAHNGYRYDSQIIQRQCMQAKIDIPTFTVFGDTLVVLRDVCPLVGRRFSLQALHKEWVENKKKKNEECMQEHRAASDVCMLISVMQECPHREAVYAALLKQRQC